MSVTIYINSFPFTSGKISSHLSGETNHEDRIHEPTSVSDNPATLISLQPPKGSSFVTLGLPRVGAGIQMRLLRLGPKGERSGRNPGTM